MAQSPDLKYAWSLEYTIPQAFGLNGDTYFRYDESYQDESFRRPAGIGWDDLDDPDAIVPSWRTGNFQAGFQSENDWALTLFVRNVWGETASSYLSSYKWWLETDIPGNADRGLQVMERTLQRPRTYNLQFSKKF